EAAERVAGEIDAAGGKALALPADVAVVAEIDAMIARTIAELGRLDVLVNNAGLIRANPIGQVTEQDWDVTFAVNARGLFFPMQSAARVMVERGGGCIVNIASIAGRGSPTLSPPYAASKAAVISLTQQCARTLAPRGVRVNAICPGIVDTEFNWKLHEQLGVRG